MVRLIINPHIFILLQITLYALQNIFKKRINNVRFVADNNLNCFILFIILFVTHKGYHVFFFGTNKYIYLITSNSIIKKKPTSYNYTHKTYTNIFFT